MHPTPLHPLSSQSRNQPASPCNQTSHQVILNPILLNFNSRQAISCRNMTLHIHCEYIDLAPWLPGTHGVTSQETHTSS